MARNPTRLLNTCRWKRPFSVVFSRIGLVVAAPVTPESATPEALQALVLGLRGDAR